MESGRHRERVGRVTGMIHLCPHHSVFVEGADISRRAERFFDGIVPIWSSRTRFMSSSPKTANEPERGDIATWVLVSSFRSGAEFSKLMAEERELAFPELSLRSMALRRPGAMMSFSGAFS